MRSSASFTNKKRVLAEASVTKVQYPGRVANNNDSILSVKNCSPNFDQLEYNVRFNCPPPQRIPYFGCNIDGGNSTTESETIILGQGSSFIFDGNGTCSSTSAFGSMLDGGNALTNINIVISGGDSSTNNVDIFDGLS